MHGILYGWSLQSKQKASSINTLVYSVLTLITVVVVPLPDDLLHLLPLLPGPGKRQDDARQLQVFAERVKHSVLRLFLGDTNESVPDLKTF